MFRVIIQIGPSFLEAARFSVALDNLLSNKLEDPGPSQIEFLWAGRNIMGLGWLEKWATDHPGVTVTQIQAPSSVHGRKAGIMKNKKLIELGNALITFGPDYDQFLYKAAKRENLLIRQV